MNDNTILYSAIWTKGLAPWVPNKSDFDFSLKRKNDLAEMEALLKHFSNNFLRIL